MQFSTLPSGAADEENQLQQSSRRMRLFSSQIAPQHAHPVVVVRERSTNHHHLTCEKCFTPNSRLPTFRSGLCLLCFRTRSPKGTGVRAMTKNTKSYFLNHLRYINMIYERFHRPGTVVSSGFFIHTNTHTHTHARVERWQWKIRSRLAAIPLRLALRAAKKK